jgi:tRNA-uridine 2-sulfurtransferase
MSEHTTYEIVSGIDPETLRSRSVAVAMSGGVDSSLSAAQLVEAGCTVTGFTMKLSDSSGAAIEDAARVAEYLGIPHHVVDLRDRFECEVVTGFVSEYLAGRTPNPCVRCNPRIKWGALREAAREAGCDTLATGHYARIARLADGGHALVRGTDRTKDQTYFLWAIPSEALQHTLFPLGTRTKDSVRSEADSRGLPTAARPDSQEICFVPDDDYRAFLLARYPDGGPSPLGDGDVLDASGTVIGRHRGTAFYTIGQRKGIGVAIGVPAYVTAIDTKSNTVTIGSADDLFSHRMHVADTVWSSGIKPDSAFQCTVHIRYRHRGTTALVTPTTDGAEVTFDSPERAISPGQSAVFYDGDLVRGGGIIMSAHTTDT